jgi:hypothetical protein
MLTTEMLSTTQGSSRLYLQARELLEYQRQRDMVPELSILHSLKAAPSPYVSYPATRFREVLLYNNCMGM